MDEGQLEKNVCPFCGAHELLSYKNRLGDIFHKCKNYHWWGDNKTVVIPPRRTVKLSGRLEIDSSKGTVFLNGVNIFHILKNKLNATEEFPFLKFKKVKITIEELED